MDIRARVTALNTERLRAWNEAQSLLDHVANERRDMSAEESAQWKRINDHIDSIDGEIRQFVEREEREREAASLREASAHLFRTESAVVNNDANEAAVIRSFLRGDGPRQLSIPVGNARKELGYIRDGASPMEARALAWDTGTSGSLIPTTLARSLYQYLEASVAMFRAPTTKIVTTSGEPMEFPFLTAHSIGTQVAGQGTTFAGTDPTFDKLALGAYKYGQLVKVASEVVDDASYDVATFLGRDMGRGLGRYIAAHLVTGTGTGQPRGIMVAATGSGSIFTGGTAVTLTYEKLVDLQHSLIDEYRMGGSAGWLMKDSTAGDIRKLRDGGGGTVGAPLWEPSLTNGITNGMPDRLLGDPVYRDPNVAAQGSAARSVAYLDFSAYMIRQVGDVVVELDRSRYFDTDEIGARAKWRLDADLIDPDAVATSYQHVS